MLDNLTKGFFVSIHAPAWGATKQHGIAHPHRICFNPRPRVGGDPERTAVGRQEKSFNPRPRVGGDWSAAIWCRAQKRFNPRPRVGGDVYCRIAFLVSASFNPRPRVGGDLIEAWTPREQEVSIHAPAWGATLGAPGRPIKLESFNPRPRVGGDIRTSP